MILELKSHTFKPEDRLKDLGANSLDRSEIIDIVNQEKALAVIGHYRDSSKYFLKH